MQIERNKFLQSSLLFLLFTLLAILALFPFYSLALASLKPSKEMLRYGLNVRLQPELLSFHNYSFLFSASAKKYLIWYKNSIVISVVYTLCCLLLSSMVGYGLAMYRFVGRNLIFLFVLLVMMVPVEIIMLPLYKQMISFRLIDTYAGVILPFVVAPLPIFFFRQYAAGLPKDFLDAGRIDGCSEYGIFFKIMMPLMAPAFGAMAILQALASWNSFVWPLIVLKTGEKLTLPIGLSSLVTPYGNNYDILIAGSVLAIVPILIVFIFFQRFFVSGLTVGGVKG
ncbi:carbohydrate ABC transporter permease [Paenibacillus sp. CGMCC 1.16610]|uniref:ABC transporter permease subunit n=1 Tax=Paenibacillus anseongense TaxID=2682845 RepID=A0ABW9U0E7_9BACL|nr:MULTISPECIES: carbohydrate ABC transporter permease [Paenibacillus]MBA2942987.1 carbohydrate ABC transporter permease [Paenibacillus sp. CGMCC 1.16610]MVQ33483.1 ABC transporter permease subunit [Paenibacillus anseongense]